MLLAAVERSIGIAARLAPLVYQSLETANYQYQLYATWEQAVNDLAKGLARLRALLQQPAARKEG